MGALKYKIIHSENQYDEYCDHLHSLLEISGKKNQHVEDEIELLTWLIRKWDEEHSIFKKLNPVALIKSLMKDHDLKAKDLAELLNVNKSYVSEVLNYKKALSKDSIRKLSKRFKISQEAFNRPYKLKNPIYTSRGK